MFWPVPAVATEVGKAPRARRARIPPAGQGLAWAIVAMLACASMIRLEPNLVEEGLVVHVAQRLARGEHLYRDIIFFSGPLAFELLGALFRIFGEEILVGRVVAALIQGVNAAVAFALVRRAGGGVLAHGAAAGVAALPPLLFPFFSMFYYTPLATSLALWASFSALRGSDSTRWACLAGALVAGVALCKQTLGVSLAAALGLALILQTPAAARLARAGGLLAGGAGVALATLAFYGVRGDLPELWRCLVTLPLSLGETFSSRYMNLWPPGRLAEELVPHRDVYFPSLYFLQYGVYVPLRTGMVLLTQLLYALPFLALFATALARIAGPLPAAAWMNAALLIAMTTNLFPRADWGHLVYVLPAAGLQLALLAASPLARVPRLRVVVALGLVTLFAGYGVRIGEWLIDSSAPPSWGPRVPLRPVNLLHRVATVPRVIRYIRDRTHPGDPIFVARAEPLLYFATDTVNPTPFAGVLQVLKQQQEDAILAALPRVRFVVMSDIDTPMWAFYADELPRVQKYLEQHFRIPRSFPHDDASWILVLERGEDAGATWLDLIDAWAGARAWTLDASRAEQVYTEMPERLVSRHNRRGLPIRLGHWGGGIDYHFSVPAGARFESGVGYRRMISGGDAHEHPRKTRMQVSVGVDGVFEVVAEQRVSDAPMEGRRWTPIEVDLARWAGREITLRLAAVPEVPVGRRNLSWWASPRIVVGAAPAE